MKHQVLFSLKDKSKKLNYHLLQFLFGALRVNTATLQIPEMKTDELANSTVPDEVAQNETPHLDLHCLPSIASEFSMI